jgi:ubiquinone/menaquinone biosynthesis C-methylase UbiE
MKKIFNALHISKTREEFYSETLNALIDNKGANILVCGGGELDVSVFKNLGFENVTISNLDERNADNQFYPFKYSFENAESLSFKNNSFDYVIIHAAIHHASSPHKVLTEMFRVSKFGFIAFESRDSIVMRLIEKLNLTETYETSAVFFNKCRYGGVNNSNIPNYIYRWTEREIEKTIQSYCPYYKNDYIYRYGTAFPATIGLGNNSILKLITIIFAAPFYFTLSKIFKKQQNLFAFFVKKNPNNLFPWLLSSAKTSEYVLNEDWITSRYRR